MKNFLKKSMLGLILIFLGSGMILNAIEPVKGPAFALSNEKSTLNWKGTKPGGMHYGVVEVVNGNVETDGKIITGGNFIIDLNTIVCEDLENESFNTRLVDHLKSEDFFHTEAYPRAFFNINSVKEQLTVKDDFVGTHIVSGDLTIRGVTKEVSFPASIRIDNDRMSAETSEITLDRTEWNVNFKSKKLFSNIADSYIDDEMVISLDLNFDIK